MNQIADDVTRGEKIAGRKPRVLVIGALGRCGRCVVLLHFSRIILNRKAFLNIPRALKLTFLIEEPLMLASRPGAMIFYVGIWLKPRREGHSRRL